MQVVLLKWHLGSRMLRSDRFIASCASWSDFWEGTKRLSSTSEKGAVLSASHNYIFKPYPNIDQNLNTSGHFARCRRMCANGSPFQPSTKASISLLALVTANIGQSSQNSAASKTSRLLGKSWVPSRA